MTTSVTGAASAATSALEPGTVVGGRFRVEAKAREDELGTVFRARDTKTQKAISLRRIRPGLLDADAIKKLRAECRTAASLSHRNLAVTYGVGNASGSPFIAAEFVEGKPMSAVVRDRAAKGGNVSLRGAYNVVASVCRALETVHEKTCHGAVRPSVVWVTESGRVKLADLGLGKALVEARGPAVFDARDQASLAPEVKAGQPPTIASDIFGVGALLYELLTAKSPADGFVPPSQAHAECDASVDEILLKCLAPDPAARYQSADAVRSALQPIVGDTEAPGASEDFGFDVDLDFDEAPAQTASRPKVAPPPPRPPAGPAAAPGPFPTPAAGPMSAPAGDEVDLGSLLAKITENDAARWMAIKDRLDHGPFTGRELVELIVEGEIREEHELMNMDTGERRPVAEWEDFTEFVEQRKIREAQSAKKAALAHAEKSEARSGMFKIMVAGGALLAVLIGIGIFLATRDGGEEEVVASAEMGDLYERGGIELTGTAGILPDPPRGSAGRRRGMGGGRSAGFAGSYEDAMNIAIELGDATMAGGQSRLSPAQVQGVMNRHLNGSVGRCADRESGIGNVTIDIAIAGSGQVMGVSARQGSSGFKSCIRNAVRRIRFPSFGAPRMGARFSFNAS